MSQWRESSLAAERQCKKWKLTYQYFIEGWRLVENVCPYGLLLHTHHARCGGDKMHDILHIFIYVISHRISYLEETLLVIYFNPWAISHLIDTFTKFSLDEMRTSVSIFIYICLFYTVFFHFNKNICDLDYTLFSSI